MWLKATVRNSSRFFGSCMESEFYLTFSVSKDVVCQCISFYAGTKKKLKKKNSGIFL